MCKGMAERELLMPSSGLPEACALLEGHVSIHVPAAGRALVGSGGRRGCRCGLRASGAAVGHLQASLLVAGRLHSWQSWPEQVAGCKGGRGVGQICPGSGSPKLSSGTSAFTWDSPAGRQGAGYLPTTALWEGVIRWDVGLQMQEPLV